MNTTDTFEILNSKLSRDRLFNTVVVALLFFIGIIGNSAVIFIFKMKIKSDRESRYLIPVLAGFDIIACTSGCILSILRNSYRAEFPSDTLCKILFYIISAMTSISALILMLISIVRYRKIFLVDRQETSLKCQTIMVISTSLAAASVAIPMSLLHGVREYGLKHRNETFVIKSCTSLEVSEELRKVKLIYYVLVLLVLLIVVLVMAVLYGKIGHIIFKEFRTAVTKVSFSKTTSSTDVSGDCFDVKETTNRTKRKRKMEMRMRTNFTLMFIVVTVLFVISYLPSLVFLILPGNNPDEFWMKLPVMELNAYLTLSRIYLFTHALNPFVYLYFDLSFRRALSDCCRTFIIRK